MQPSWNISLSINLYHCYVTGIHATRSTTIKELHSFLGRNAGIFRGRKNYKPLNFFPFSFARCFEEKKKRKEGRNIREYLSSWIFCESKWEKNWKRDGKYRWFCSNLYLKRREESDYLIIKDWNNGVLRSTTLGKLFHSPELRYKILGEESTNRLNSPIRSIS